MKTHHFRPHAFPSVAARPRPAQPRTGFRLHSDGGTKPPVPETGPYGPPLPPTQGMVFGPDTIERVYPGESLTRISPYKRGNGDKPLTFFLTPAEENVFSYGNVIELPKDGIAFRESTVSAIRVPTHHDFVVGGKVPAHLMMEKIAQQGGLRIIARFREAPGKDVPYLFFFKGWSDLKSTRELVPGEQILLHTKVTKTKGTYGSLIAFMELGAYAVDRDITDANQKEALTGIHLHDGNRIFFTKVTAGGQPGELNVTDGNIRGNFFFESFLRSQVKGVDPDEFSAFRTSRFSTTNDWLALDALIENQYDFLGVKHLGRGWEGFKSHFGEDCPVVPGVVLLEWALQTAGLQAVKLLRQQGTSVSAAAYQSLEFRACDKVNFQASLSPRMAAGIKIEGNKLEGLTVVPHGVGRWLVTVNKVLVNGFSNPDALTTQLAKLAHESWFGVGTPIVSFPNLQFLLVDSQATSTTP